MLSEVTVPGLELLASDLEAYEVGTAVLGSGGGGPSPIGLSMVRHALRTYPLPRVRALAELDTDAVVLPIGVYGSTGTMREKAPSGDEFRQVLADVVAVTGERPDALIGMEVAGLNGSMLLLAAMTTGIDLADAELMGRALPRLDQLAFAVDGVPLAPTTVVTATGSSITVKETAPAGVERVLRGYLQEAGGWAAVGFSPVAVPVARRSAVQGSIAHALALGRALHQGAVRGIAATVEPLGGRVLGEGRVDEVAHRPTGRQFLRGTASLRDRGGVRVRVEFENEFLVVLRDGEPVATTPDLICVLDQRSGRLVNCDQMRSGADVVVLHLPGAGFWRAPHRLSAVEPRAFGMAVEATLSPEGW